MVVQDRRAEAADGDAGRIPAIAAAPRGGRPARPTWRLRAAARPETLMLVAALACWVAALTHADLGAVAGYGLLSALPATYYGGLALLTCGFAVAACRPRVRPSMLGAYVLALVAMLHATVPLLYDEPRYAWTYKHLGVIDYITVHGSVDRSVDVYQNWPGFFALNAWFSRAAGISPIDYAAWAQPFFALVAVAACLFAFRGITSDTRLQWTGAWLFVVANWIGQDYLAPQAFGFVIVVVIVGIAVRCARDGRPTRLARRIVDRIAAVALRGRPRVEHEQRRPPLGPRAALAVGGVCTLAVVISHQLSPVMLIAALAGLAVLLGRPRPWVVVAVIGMEIWWVALSWAFVSLHFKIFSFDPGASARPSVSAAYALPGVALGADLSRAGMVLTVLLALLGARRRLRAGRWDLAAGVLAFAPFPVQLLQSYNGEGPLRSYLFALPWLAFFAAAACLPSVATHGSAARRSWRLLAATCVIGTATLFGYFGQELVNATSADDVAASRWYLNHSAPGATLTGIGPNFPDRLNARYAHHLDSPPTLITAAGFRPHELGRRDLPALEALLWGERAPERYVVVSPSGERYGRFYGLVPAGSFARIGRALRRSPDFRLVYRRGATSIFRFVPRQ